MYQDVVRMLTPLCHLIMPLIFQRSVFALLMFCMFPFDFYFYHCLTIYFKLLTVSLEYIQMFVADRLQTILSYFSSDTLTIDSTRVLFLGHSIVCCVHLFLTDEEDLHLFSLFILYRKMVVLFTLYVVSLIYGAINLTDYIKNTIFTPLTYVTSIFSREKFSKTI